MKNIIILTTILFTASSFGACNLPIARDNFFQGDIVSSAKINKDFDDLYAQLNDLSGDCINSFSIQEDALADNSITEEKIQDESVTREKFALSVIPTFAAFTRIRVFTSSGTYITPPNIEKILVQVVGGGAAFGWGGGGPYVSHGGDSSFGSHCIARGGKGSANPFTPVGGTSTGGDINITGDVPAVGVQSIGGGGLLGDYGVGGCINGFNDCYRAAGGAYCAKLIDKALLSNQVAVVVGQGGAGSSDFGPANGRNGIVIIQEFTR